MKEYALAGRKGSAMIVPLNIVTTYPVRRTRAVLSVSILFSVRYIMSRERNMGRQRKR